MPRMPLWLFLSAATATAVMTPSARAAGWECRSTDAAGQCVGLSTYTEPNGTRLSGLRSSLGGTPGWSGLVIRHYPNGDRRECQADASGRCNGATTHYAANGQRDSGTMAARNGVAVWTGRLTTIFPNGDRLECAAAPEGLCEGEATLIRSGGSRTLGQLASRGRGQVWTGRITRLLANGDREECEATPEGLCQGRTTYRYADGTQLIGSKVIRGERAVWSGSVTQVFPSGRQMQCVVGAGSLCDEDTQLPVDDRGRPLPTLPR